MIFNKHDLDFIRYRIRTMIVRTKMGQYNLQYCLLGLGLVVLTLVVIFK